ncbi:MAG: UDP-N-acetylmuramate--L-alanine ligase [Bifidobacteriaceae bacterium]|jgi:UDP-N-acetylmuramate--alanine ligase|nr:UDP-N-acetylmuramate--L-alanine ligase [Bifidobacteriaceae bacterium]
MTNKVIHFIGIGGAGMATLAQMYYNKGYKVQGSDQTDINNNVKALQKLGLKVFVGHKASNLDLVNIVVISTAIKSDNPELIAAKKQTLPIWHRAKALAQLVNLDYLFAVAGAHGKTTTAAMLAFTLQELGVDCSYSFGANMINDCRSVTGGYVGKDKVAVIEADESDGSFLDFTPNVSIILNIEADHLDYYKSETNFLAAFAKFATKASNKVIFCGDDKKVYNFIKSLNLSESLSYGTANYNDILLKKPLGIKLAGKHNQLNALSVFISVKQFLPNIVNAKVYKALALFPGTYRRFEFKGSVGSVRLFDDYAHLPSEIQATILAARDLLKSDGQNKGKIRVLFQSHLFSRTLNFAQGFAQALALADEVIVTDVYAARESINPDVTPSTILQYMSKTVPHWAIRDRVQAAEKLGSLAKPNDILLTLGAGDLNILDKQILNSINVR